MNKENCALKLVDEIILYYDARSKKHQTAPGVLNTVVPASSVVKESKKSPRSFLTFLTFEDGGTKVIRNVANSGTSQMPPIL